MSTGLLFFAGMTPGAPRAHYGHFDGIGRLLTFVGFGLLVLGATLAGEFGWWDARLPFDKVTGRLRLWAVGSADLHVGGGRRAACPHRLGGVAFGARLCTIVSDLPVWESQLCC